MLMAFSPQSSGLPDVEVPAKLGTKPSGSCVFSSFGCSNGKIRANHIRDFCLYPGDLATSCHGGALGVRSTLPVLCSLEVPLCARTVLYIRMVHCASLFCYRSLPGTYLLGNICINILWGNWLSTLHMFGCI